MQLWRIALSTHAAFDGEGAKRYGSRWTPKGLAVVYASATLSLATLERFVHTDPDLEPADLVAVRVGLEDGITTHSIDIEQLPPDWRDYPAPEALGRFGGDWLAASRSVALSLPSAVIPHERNYLLNPAHADFRRLVIGRPEPFSFDPRMWARRRPR